MCVCGGGKERWRPRDGDREGEGEGREREEDGEDEGEGEGEGGDDTARSQHGRSLIGLFGCSVRCKWLALLPSWRRILVTCFLSTTQTRAPKNSGEMHAGECVSYVAGSSGRWLATIIRDNREQITVIVEARLFAAVSSLASFGWTGRWGDVGLPCWSQGGNIAAEA